MSEELCPCGEYADHIVRVQWADGPRIYHYCAQCADDIQYAIEGAEVIGAMS